MTKELVARRAVEDFGRDGQQPEVQIATTQENTVNLNQEKALVSQVAQQGLEALRARLAETTAHEALKPSFTSDRSC